MKRTQVLIAGGGPVGLMLANVLGHYGVATLLAERNFETTRHPKMDITNGRSMELFRKFALADALRKVAVPESHPFDVAWITSFAGHELHRFRYPSPQDVRRTIRATNDGTQPREPAMRVSQVEIEPALKKQAKEKPSVDVRFGVAFEDFREDEAGVVATLRDRDRDITEEVRCDYLIGCDGGGSRVRELLDINLEGTFRVAQRYTVHFRSNARDILQRWGIAWHYQSYLGTMIAQNDHDIWTLHGLQDPGVAAEDMDPAAVLRRFAGQPVEHEVLVANGWTPHLLVAESCGRGRVLLAGDAAHQYIPTGGYGMNTGIGDAVDLGWKLAATIGGFGGPDLLASYEPERHPVWLRNREGSGRHTRVRMAIAQAYRDNIADGEDLSAERRAAIAARIADLGNAENESYGIEFGYNYASSPIVAAEAGAHYPTDSLRYVPTTLPGVRLPSSFLQDGTALFDRLDAWFTLIDFGNGDRDGFVQAAGKAGVPLAVLTLNEPELERIYGQGMLLVRPDQHIAWRGSPNTDADAERVLRQTLGFAP